MNPPTTTLTSSETITPEIQAANFYHLYWDVAWFGLAFGTTLSFIAVYATRLGAAGWQIGLLSAGPALINVLCTVSAARWLEPRPLGPAVVQTAFWQRLGFLALVPLPWLLPQSWQVWSVLAITLLTAIPGTALAIGFNGLLAATVPPDKRGHVVGRRNALLAGFIMAAFIISGQILQATSLELGYTIVFALGALGGALSTYHLSRVRVPAQHVFQGQPLGDMAQPGRGLRVVDSPRSGVGMRLWLTEQLQSWRLGQWVGPRFSRHFQGVMVAFLLFHFAQFLPIPLFPLLWVREIGLGDGPIGWLNALFYLSMLVASPLLGPLSRRWGNRALTVWGALLLSAYPLLNALSYNFALLLVANLVGGATWAILGGALANRLLEVAPDDDRPAHLAFYNLALNVATLSSTMLGPLLADLIGIRPALYLSVALRLLAALSLARWG
jgi:hypothetical protein